MGGWGWGGGGGGRDLNLLLFFNILRDLKILTQNLASDASICLEYNFVNNLCLIVLFFSNIPFIFCVFV